MTAIKPYPVSPRLDVPASIPRPPYVGLGDVDEDYQGSHVQTPEVIEAMKEAGRIACGAMHEAGKAVAPGVTTDALDRIAHDYMCDHGAYPSTLDYRNYPKSICTSVNEVICHGIPDARPLEDGDIVKIDVTAYKNGVHGDNCYTFLCGDVDQASKDLVTHTQEAMNRAIKAVRPGRSISIIGRIIENYAKRFGYGVVHDYTGHGVHTAFHSGLIVFHYDEPRYDVTLEEGMTLTIEPMLTLGDYHSHQWDDGWTVITNDGSRCAQFEQTMVIRSDGAEILTTLG
ncbi:type I methionyl aminopeptidase [Acidipropionibacterium jensenii]|uniref:Methionine aminopeptidase n=3 Tax=Acidipropionibacterium jensenii TaxID=1749 RepID=A0A3T0S5X5_9ACTN|nr:type I methionyl aminopeptidase [Acidipropionibacterium jensenii]AZZ41742.1 type I methionyl aminopeptidase [Acidipropionibacterium jensenii]